MLSVWETNFYQRLMQSSCGEERIITWTTGVGPFKSY